MNLRVGAVSYLNTVPLIYGMQHGPQRAEVDLTFSVPSLCAAEIEQGVTDLGLVPVAEIARQRLEIVPGVGIAARGPVRSILLFSGKPFSAIETLAADASSRTSVQLARIILREAYGSDPAVFEAAPDLREMMAGADAALIIGDPALRIEPGRSGYAYLDLAEEWRRLTGLPFVFAAWAGKPGIAARAAGITTGSYEFGRGRLTEIVEAESTRRGIGRDLAERYLREHLRYELGPEEWRGLEEFWKRLPS